MRGLCRRIPDFASLNPGYTISNQSALAQDEPTRGVTIMSYREVSEIRDGMRIDWDMPIEMDDGVVLRCDIYRPVKARQVSGHPDLRPLRQMAALRRSLRRAVASGCARIHPDVPTGSTNKYQCWEVVDPEKWVPDGYVVRPRRQPRRRPLARRDRHLVAARGAGLGALRRLGRRAAVVERQGRPQRHLLLRREPVAVRGAAAQAPRRDLPVGGRRRFLPRHGAPRRHLLQRLHQGLVGDRRSTRCSTAAARAASGAA